VSAVVYLGDERGCADAFLKALCGQLAARFEHYELVFVEDACRDGTDGEVRRCLQAMAEKPPVTIIHLSLRQGLEPAMNAGLDMAVGDFVWEFDSMRMPWPDALILQAYDTCLEGSDIVQVVPAKNRNLASRLFYRVFNAASKSRYPLRTDVFRLLSRRAINRVRGMAAALPYRKAAYAASGLKTATLEFAGAAAATTEHMRFSRAVDSLALYTDIASRFSMGIAVSMLALMVAAVVYITVVWATGGTPPAAGWTTTMLLLSGGFFGVFLILAFVLKYLGLLVAIIFHKQVYLVESVEKLN
jgi:dolichol-phosphate mannosyltransferase